MGIQLHLLLLAVSFSLSPSEPFVQESGLRLRVCATREAAAAERRRLAQLRGEHRSELDSAARLLAAAATDSPLLRGAVRDRLAQETEQVGSAETRETREKLTLLDRYTRDWDGRRKRLTSEQVKRIDSAP